MKGFRDLKIFGSNNIKISRFRDSKILGYSDFVISRFRKFRDFVI